MATLAQTSDGDLDLSQRNFTIVSDPAAACAIKLFNRFRMGLGEWFLDTRIGVPYYQLVFVKNPDLGAIRQLFRKIILATEPVERVDELDLTFNASERSLTFSFKCTTDAGAVITGGTGKPFIVEVA